MPERRRPDLDQVRETLRDHDERSEGPPEPPEPEPEPPPPSAEDDESED